MTKIPETGIASLFRGREILVAFMSLAKTPLFTLGIFSLESSPFDTVRPEPVEG